MKLSVTFEESKQTIAASFGEVQTVSSGDYEQGYQKGLAEGYSKGFSAGQDALPVWEGGNY